jgi:hypothetical protein
LERAVDGNKAEISSVVVDEAWDYAWHASIFAEWDEDFLSQIHDFDFRYIRT